MTQVLCIGDHLAEGTYSVHSRFDDVVNFAGKDSLVSVASERVGPGPINIVTRGLNFEAVDMLQVMPCRLRLDGHEYPFDDTVCFSSGVDIVGNIELDRLAANLASLEDTLITLSPSKSLAFLIDPERQREFVTSFDLEYARRMEEGAGAILGGALLDGVGVIRGLGYGLTPSGDDFIAGLLLAYNIAGKIGGFNRSEISDEIYSIALGENLISNSGLLCAKNGWMTQKQKTLIAAMLYSGQDDVVESAGRVLATGETSGADWGVGFLMTMKEILRV